MDGTDVWFVMITDVPVMYDRLIPTVKLSVLLGNPPIYGVTVDVK
jgi:hypothetical protein